MPVALSIMSPYTSMRVAIILCQQHDSRSVSTEKPRHKFAGADDWCMEARTLIARAKMQHFAGDLQINHGATVNTLVYLLSPLGDAG